MHPEYLLSTQFVTTHPLDAARILERLPVADTAAYLLESSPVTAATVLQRLAPSIASQCLGYLEAKSAAAMTAHLPVDLAAVLLRRVDTETRTAILEHIASELATPLRLVLRYPEGTAGALMNPQVCTLPDDLIVQDAIEHLRRHPDDVDDSVVFVLNRQHLLMGYLRIGQLLLAQPEDRIHAIMRSQTNSLSPTMSQQSVMIHPLWHHFHTLPVVDALGVFLGSIDYGTLRRIEYDAAAQRLAERGTDAGAALGELYWIGLSSIVKGAISAVERRPD